MKEYMNESINGYIRCFIYSTHQYSFGFLFTSLTSCDFFLMTPPGGKLHLYFTDGETEVQYAQDLAFT